MHLHACSSALSSTKTIDYIAIPPEVYIIYAKTFSYSIGTLKRASAIAELLVECKCQFIRVKQEQASEKLEKTTISIVEPSMLSS